MKKIVQTAGRNALGEFAPEFAHYNDDVLFGENWNNQNNKEMNLCKVKGEDYVRKFYLL